MVNNTIKRVFLGLDVSTKTVGVTIASENEKGEIKILLVTHLRPKIPTKIKGTEALFMKSNIICEELAKYKEYNITNVVIEEPLIGSNNSMTVATLLRYNGMISQSVYNILGIVPEFISSYDARTFACPHLMAIRKYNKKGEVYPENKIRNAIKKGELVLFGQYSFDCAKKLILWNYVSEKFPYIEWQYDKNNNLKEENFDASDSLICVLGYISKEKYKDTKPEIITSTEEKTGNGTLFHYTTRFCGQEFEKIIEL